MRRLTILGVMAGVILLLALALPALQPASDVTATTAPAAESNSYRMLYTRSQADFSSMRVTLASGESYTVETSLAFDPAGNLLGVYNNLGQPVTVSGQNDFALASTAFQMMLLTAVNLPVTASYPGLDPASCGLDAPSALIEITYKASAPIVLRVGKPTASGYSCYVTMDGDDSVHLVPLDFHDVMTRPLKEHHRLPGATTPTGSAVQIAIVRPGEQNFIATNHAGENRILAWQIEQPYLHAGSTDRIRAFVERLCAIEADGYEASAATLEELAPYGLDDPIRLLAAFSDGSIRDIHIGSNAGDGMVYARMDSTGDVYRIRTTRLPALNTPFTDDLLDRFVALVSTAESTAVTVQTADMIRIFHQIRDDAGEVTSYTVNGAPISQDAFNACYLAIVGMQFDKTTTVAPAGSPLCTVRFDLISGEARTVAYYPYDPHYVQAVTSGGAMFLLRTERLEAMLAPLSTTMP